jgi:hypothetical protein
MNLELVDDGLLDLGREFDFDPRAVLIPGSAFSLGSRQWVKRRPSVPGLVWRALFRETARMHRLRFALEFVGCAGVGVLAGVVLRHDDSLYFALIILGFGLCAGFLAHLILGLRARWRYHYVTICRFFSLALVAIFAFAMAVMATDRSDDKVARDYLLQIQPVIEDYRQTTGQYPDALSDLSHLPTPPVGFIYRRDRDRSSDNPESYRIDYFSEEYWSASGAWSDDN